MDFLSIANYFFSWSCLHLLFSGYDKPTKTKEVQVLQTCLVALCKTPNLREFPSQIERFYSVCVSLFALVRKPGRDHQKLYLWYETTFLSGLAYLCVVPDGAWTWTRHLSLWTMNQKIRSRKSKYTISNVVSEEATGNFGWHHEFFFGVYDRN